MGINTESSLGQRMRLHLNYGSNGAGYIYDLLDGEKVIGIRMVRTGKESADIWEVEGEEFDAKEGGKKNALEWLKRKAELMGGQPK